MRAAVNSTTRSWILALCLSLFVAPAGAQEGQDGQQQSNQAQQGQASGQQSGGAAAQDNAQTRAEELEAAYKKEFAFLAAQKRDLQQRLANFRDRAQQERGATQGEIDQLQGQIVRLTNEVDQLEQQVQEAERAIQANKESQNVLDATFQQAEVTLEEHGVQLFEQKGFTEASDEGKIEQLFQSADETMARLSQVRETEGSFFLQDGSKAEGTIVKVGAIAAYGISDQGSGALAPAGGGRLKLWPEPAADVASAFAAGNQPELLKLFLYESLNENVETEGEETIVEHINSGGTIAWIIMGLGAFALLLIILRALFLTAAGSSTEKIERKVGDLVREGKVEEAQEAVRRMRGSGARVVRTALRNLQRDREHLEDIISESILSEQSTLNRFGAVILVIAAVTPLLGLLGTVTGMISTFDVITKFGTGDPKLLSGGISTALVTTELGLAVAIPTLLIGNLLSGWAERIKDEMEKAALRVTNLYEEARA